MPARLSTLAPAERSFVHGPSCLAGSSHAATFAKLTRCAPPPTDRAGWMAACQGALACLRAASSLARTLSPSAQEILTEFSALLVHLDNITPSHLAESAQPMWRRLAQFPQWVALTRASRHSDAGQLAALGLELFYCLHQDSVMAPESTRALLRVESGTLLQSQIQEILMAPKTDLLDAPIWAQRMNRLWPALREWLDAAPAQMITPAESGSERLRKALVAKCVYASPKHRGAILDHRHIDSPQLFEIGKQIWQGVFNKDGHAVAAMLTWLSSTTVDALKDIPLAAHRLDDWIMCIDVEQGLFCTDIQCIATDMAMPIAGEGHVAASTQVNKPMPRVLQQFLLDRFITTPEARCLGHLLPELTEIKPHEPVIATTREIVPSMARWTNSSGVLMRQLGIDGLVAALLSNDFAMVPKSKLYYSCVSAKEIWDASARIFALMGWGPPAEMPPNLLAAGSPVVPTEPQIKKVFVAIKKWVEEARPAKRCTSEALFEFHRRYCTSVAWLVSFGSASRQVSQLEWPKDMLTNRIGLLVMDDKQVTDLEGGLPVPFGRFLREQVDLYVQHLEALHRRLTRHAPARPGNALLWLEAVLGGDEVPLFKTISGWRCTRSVGTSTVLAELPENCQVAPDSGRKYWETRLRHLAVTTSSIDGMLRHEVLGQERFSCASDFIVKPTYARVASILDQELFHIFHSPIPGLRGATSREDHHD